MAHTCFTRPAIIFGVDESLRLKILNIISPNKSCVGRRKIMRKIAIRRFVKQIAYGSYEGPKYPVQQHSLL